ncbi:MAG: SnoaL-like domain-containing protein [Gammaproteobacteria bacterium]|nr:SnoaL-like domain-containing protein [Gammaproteobacteria bacterium]
MTPTDVVLSFIAAWNANDLERILAHLHEEVVYHNMPVAPLHGRAAVRAYLDGKGGFERIHWQLLAIAADGNKVLTERVDDFTLKGVDVSLPLMGIFEVEGALIRAWRDYFDLDTYRRQLAGAIPG